MKKFLSSAFLICLFCACDKPAQQQEKQLLHDDTLALVGAMPITQTDFDTRTVGMDKEFKDFIKTPAGRENFLNFLINERLLYTAAADNKIEQSKEFISEMEKIQKEQETAFEEHRRYLMGKLLTEKLQKSGVLAVKEEEVRAYHRKYPYQITIAHILMSDPQKAAAVMREAGAARTLANFGELVRKFSIAPNTKKDDGVLTPFIPGEYLPEIEVAAANTPAMQVQGFIKTPLGFHIIMKVKEESLSYNNAKDRITAILEKQKMDEYLNTLKQRYPVEVINNEVK
jgi:parvulin-like peptidyl-prolyl isomerase